MKKVLQINKTEKGFTLIEMLVYVAIFSVVIGGLVSFIQLMSQSRINNQTVLEVNDQGTEVARLITQALRNAVSINSPATSTSASTLSLNTILASTTPTTFTLIGGALYRTEGANAAVRLTNNKIIVNSITFSNVSRAGTLGTVRISFLVSSFATSNAAYYNYSANFYASGSLK